MKPVITAVAAFLMLASAAAAQGPMGPCKADVEKFCKDIEPGEGRIIACLKAHEAELSAECKTRDLEAKGPKEKKGNGLIEACKADLDKLCAGVKDGPGGKMRCLKENEAALSEGCKAKFGEQKEKMQKANPCLADVEKFCKDVKPGEGRIIACLKTHDAELSAECKARGPEAKDRKGKGHEAGAEGKGQKKKKDNGFREACKADLDKLCADVPAGHGAKIRCLKKNEAALSEGCKAGLDKAKEKLNERRGDKGGPGGGKPEGAEEASEPPAPSEGE